MVAKYPCFFPPPHTHTVTIPKYKVETGVKDLISESCEDFGVKVVIPKYKGVVGVKNRTLEYTEDAGILMLANVGSQSLAVAGWRMGGGGVNLPRPRGLETPTN